MYFLPEDVLDILPVANAALLDSIKPIRFLSVNTLTTPNWFTVL